MDIRGHACRRHRFSSRPRLSAFLQETGLLVPASCLADWKQQNTFETFQEWRRRYPPDTTHSIEHTCALTVAHPFSPTLSPLEHCGAIWLPLPETCARVFSWSNRGALEQLTNPPLRGPVIDPLAIS